LSEVLEQWSRCADIETIRSQAKAIFQRGQIARRILRGVRIVIAGPPNSGKSTLLNRLTGGEQALVSGIQGTTRDWIAAFGRIEPLWIEWIDTAGLDEDLAGMDTLEQIAQQQTHYLLNHCDLILYVLDTSKPQWTQQLPAPSAIPLITVLNKYDISHIVPPEPDKEIAISALCGMNLDHLSRRILQTLQVESFEPALPAAFTERQIRLLEKLTSAKNLSETKSLVQQLFGIGRTV
jgi:tRNA modification GTPase